MAANPGRNAGAARHPMAWQATVWGMIEAGAKVHACCSRCNLWRPVDLFRLASERGPDFSLWDKQSTCPTVRDDGTRCPGRVFYHARAGSVSRPLRSF